MKVHILSTAAPFYRVVGQSVMKRAEKNGVSKAAPVVRGSDRSVVKRCEKTLYF